MGGDPRLLARLLRHPALNIISRLHKSESEKTAAAARLEGISEMLNGVADAIGTTIGELLETDFPQSKMQHWIQDIRQANKIINRIKLGLEIERYRHSGGIKRRGLVMFHPERYFYTAFLAPYTAFLNQSRGKMAAPDWEWIERWLRESAITDETRDLALRGWWNKEVLKRNSQPSQTLLYALTAGAAVYLEKSSGGKQVKWVTEWVRPNYPARTESHPLPLQRTVTSKDMTYMACVFKYVPFASDNFKRLYPKPCVKISVQSHDPLKAILHKKAEEGMEAAPARVKILASKFKGEPLNTKALFKKELARLRDLSRKRK